MKKNKGFTLIELLVVIAIIGILSSVVLASLSNARDKAKDASVKSQLASLKAQAELYYSAHETYLHVCDSTAANNGFKELLRKTVGISGVSVSAELNLPEYNDGVAAEPVANIDGAFNKVTCHETVGDGSDLNPDAWVVDAPLSDSDVPSGIPPVGPSMYCSDSTGASKVTSTPLIASDTKCPN